MCRIKNLDLGIKKLSFTEKKGMMAVYLTDGREILVPVSKFHDIRYLPMKEREKWFILDDQFFSFDNLSTIYSITDVLNYNLTQH